MKLKTKVTEQDGKPVITINSGGVTGTLNAPDLKVGQVVEVTVAEIVGEDAPAPAPLRPLNEEEIARAREILAERGLAAPAAPVASDATE